MRKDPEITAASGLAQPRRRINTGIRWTVLCWRVLLLAAILVGWQLGADRGFIDPFFVSTPKAVAAFTVDFIASGDVWNHLMTTIRTVLLGFALGAVTGVVLGFTLARFDTLHGVLNPFLVAINSIPRVALAPLFILWFGIGDASKVYLAASLVFFIVMAAAEAGARSVDTELLTMGRVMGATETQSFAKVVLPASVPSVFSGLRLGMIYSILGVIFGEMIAARAGLGQQLSYFAGVFNTAGVFGVLLIVTVFSLSFNAFMITLERRLMRWRAP